MKAKKKEIVSKTVADYGVDIAPRLNVLKTVEPPGRKAGVKVANAAELIAKLKEAGILSWARRAGRHEMPVGGAAFVGAILAHRRDHDTVRKRQVAQGDG